MKKVIKEVLEKLIEKDFCVYIESIPKQFKLVIKTKGKSIKYLAINLIMQSKLYYIY